MVGGPWVQASICKSLISPFHNSQNFVPYLPTKPSKKLYQVRASSAGEGRNPSFSPRGKNPLALVLEVPVTIWKQTLQPLSDFGFGRRSIWEGGIGLFMVSGAALVALTLVWLRGFHLMSRLRKYHAVFQFSQACGICVGTPVRIRGVTVGSVVGVDSSLKSIDATVEFEDDKIIVPRNSLVEVNQSGLLMETLIDITPRDPLPTPSAGPLDPDCAKEDLILCDRERIRGQQGVSLDELVGIFTRIGREMEEIGFSRSYRLAEKVASVVVEARPLLAKIEALAENIQPLLTEVRDNALLKDVESLTKTLADATEDLRDLIHVVGMTSIFQILAELWQSLSKSEAPIYANVLKNVQSALLTPENGELIRQSLFAFIFTLKNIESISSDISGFTGDEAARRNLKLLIKSLSRLL